MPAAADSLKVGFVGAGNVATHLAVFLHEQGHDVVAVASRNAESAKTLAEKVGAVTYEGLTKFPADLDIVIIAASDSEIPNISSQLPEIKGIVAHTSGSIPLEALSSHHKRAAVLYPLQTFSKDIPVDLSKVPFFIEATDEKSKEVVEALARRISDSVYFADSDIRAKLHIAGVLSSNFPIYLLEMTRRVLDEAGLPLSTVKPLVEASVSKAFSTAPLEALTGPAKRGDKTIVDKQAATFKNELEREIYEAVSKAILKDFNHI